ncbi:response regulator PleD [compost metagenome]
MLKHVAHVIERVAEPIGMAARLGGDEFVMFIRDYEAVVHAEELVAKLRDSLLKEEMFYKGYRLSVGMSIGIGYFPKDGRDVDTLMNNADKDMYQIKGVSKRA